MYRTWQRLTKVDLNDMINTQRHTLRYGAGYVMKANGEGNLCCDFLLKAVTPASMR